MENPLGLDKRMLGEYKNAELSTRLGNSEITVEDVLGIDSKGFEEGWSIHVNQINDSVLITPKSVKIGATEPSDYHILRQHNEHSIVYVYDDKKR